MTPIPSDFHRTGRRSGIMLAYPFEEKRLARWEPPFLVQPKLDGERCRAVLTASGTVSLFSSESNLILSVPHIEKALQDLIPSLGLRAVELELDGELYAHGLPLETIHSIVSRRSNLHPQFDEISFHIFDLVNDNPTILRQSELLDLPIGARPLLRVPFTICHSFDDCMRQLDWATNNGFEGIIVRHIKAPYIRRRSTLMMKFKPRREDIYEILDSNEEVSISGQPKNRLGALILRAQDGEETFHVGSGFDDETRAKLWLQRDSLPGRKVRVKYQHLTSARGVPRSGIFVELLEQPKTIQFRSDISLREAFAKKRIEE